MSDNNNSENKPIDPHPHLGSILNHLEGILLKQSIFSLSIEDALLESTTVSAETIKNLHESRLQLVGAFESYTKFKTKLMGVGEEEDGK